MLMKKKGGQVWIFRASVDGKTWERSTGETDKRRAEAKVPELRRLAELHRRQHGVSHNLETAILNEIDRVEGDVSAQQARRVGDALMNFLVWARQTLRRQDIPLERIDTALLETFQRVRLKVAARSTVDKELCYMVRLLRLAGFRVDKPRAKRGKETEVRELSDEELTLFFAHCPAAQKPMFLLMLATGARSAEVIPSERSGHVALLKSEVDPAAGTVTIRTAKLTAGRKGEVRVIRIDEELMGLVVAAARQNPGHHVFPAIKNLFRYFDRILERAGLSKLDPLGRKLTAHSFRHTWATRMAEAVGGNQFILSRLLGHRQITTTNRYVHTKTQARVVEIGRYVGSLEAPPLPAPEAEWGRSMGKIGEEKLVKVS